MLSLIVAMDKNRLIGDANRLPWYLPEDLKRFKRITLGKPVIMGRRTFESIGKPLPGRRNIIVSRNPDYKVEGCESVSTLEQAIQLVTDAEESIVIGGMQIYKPALFYVERMYITQIEYEFNGDAWFPQYNQSEWKLVSTEKHQHEKAGYFYFFNILERIENIPG